MAHKNTIKLLAACAALLPFIGGPTSQASEVAAMQLARAREASGGDAWDHARIVVLSGSNRIKGIDAVWRETVDLTDGRVRDTTDFGLFKTVTVWDGQALWQQGRSGGVHPINSSFGRRNNVTNAWLAARGYLKRDALGAWLEDGTETKEAGRSFIVIRAKPPNGEPVDLWFDKQNNFLARTVQQLPTTIRTVRYDDYRSVQGVRLPFSITSDEGDPANADHIVVARADEVKGPEGDFERPSPPVDFSIEGASTTVPLEIDGFVTVQAKINGKGPFPFILDTGGRATLTAETANNLGLTLVGSGNAGGAGENALAFHFAKVDSTEIGGLTVRGLTFGVLRMDYDTIERGSHPPFAGILGLELFERLAMHLDYRHKQLSISSLAHERHPDGSVAVPISFEDDMPIVSAKIDGISGEVALDTGNPEPLVVQGIWAEQNGLKDRLRKLKLQAFGGTGGPITLWASRSNIELARTEVPGVVAYYAENKSGSLSSRTTAGIAGNAALARFSLDFNYSRGCIWFTLESGNEQQPYDRSGLSVFKPDQNAFIVGSVAEGTPAAKAGIKSGDAIAAVDGKSSSDLSGWDFGRLMRRPPGTKIVLAVRRGDKLSNIKLTLHELLP